MSMRICDDLIAFGRSAVKYTLVHSRNVTQKHTLGTIASQKLYKSLVLSETDHFNTTFTHTQNKPRQRIPRLFVRSSRRCAMHFIKNNPSGRQLSLCLSVCLPKPKRLAPKKPQSAGHGVCAWCRLPRSRVVDSVRLQVKRARVQLNALCCVGVRVPLYFPEIQSPVFCVVLLWGGWVVLVCCVSCLPDLVFR